MERFGPSLEGFFCRSFPLTPRLSRKVVLFSETFFCGKVWKHYGTVAILAQGTSWAVAIMQAFFYIAPSSGHLFPICEWFLKLVHV